MKDYVSLDWGIGIVFGDWVGCVIGDEVYSDVGGEVGEVVELELVNNILSLNMSNMESMWRLMILYTEIITEELMVKLVYVTVAG